MATKKKNNTMLWLLGSLGAGIILLALTKKSNANPNHYPTSNILKQNSEVLNKLRLKN